MNRFQALVDDVTMLNRQLRAIDDHPGSETRMLIQERLWEIVAGLDQRLNLGLENHCLDLTAQDACIRIHFWTGRGPSPETETSIYVRDGYSVERHVTDLRTGQTDVS